MDGTERELLALAMDGVAHWESQWSAFEHDDALDVPPDVARGVIAELVERLRDNYPFFHPDYAGQMLKPPHPIARVAYAAAMRINPNNHALDGGPATAQLEREAVSQIATMFGYPAEHLGHLTSSGTFANLEALWIARQLRPGAAVAFSSEAHYTHGRMCELLGVPAVVVQVDARGRMDLDALRDAARTTRIGTVLATAGASATGAVDDVEQLLHLARSNGWRLHVDAAHGGFYASIAGEPAAHLDSRVWRSLSESDSIVVDPHKHGLQPYGCGCVLFRDPSVARFYTHESPYTYFTQPRDAAGGHLGRTTLECSRPGAAAASLWAALRCFPLNAGGLGRVLLRCRRAALAGYERAVSGGRLTPVVAPELDILTLLPAAPEENVRASTASARTGAIFDACMKSREPVYFAKWHVPRAFGALALLNVDWDAPSCTVLRSVLMKPEHLSRIAYIIERAEEVAARV